MSDEKLTEFNRESLAKIAREIVIRRYVLILHTWVYIFVNILLFIINYFVSPNYPWSFWPLTAWALVLILHGITYKIFRKGIIHPGTIAMIYHASSFVLGLSLIFFISIFTAEPRWSLTQWFLWPLFGWSLGFLFHLVVFFYFVPKNSENDQKGWVERKIEKELEQLKNQEIKNSSKINNKL